MTLYAEIIIALPLDKTFIYTVPAPWTKKIKVGSRVLVSFNRRLLTGFVIRLHKKNPVSGIESKDIHQLQDENPIFSSSFLTFTRKLANYYFSPWGELLQASLPSSLTIKSRKRIYITESGLNAFRKAALTRDEKELLRSLQKNSYTEFYLKRKLQMKNFNSLTLRLERKGWILTQEDLPVRKKREKTAVPTRLTQLEIDFSLNDEAFVAAQQIAALFGKNAFAPCLLQAPAQQREAVYVYLIKRCLNMQRKVLFLVPEIALTSGIVDKLERKLGNSAALLHSRLSPRQKEEAWMRINTGDIDVVIGPRSALLAPIENLGLIIVDDEHDDSYYQKESPIYDARQGAWIRAEGEAAMLVYGSASPSVETMFRARKQAYLFAIKARPLSWRLKLIDDHQEKILISGKILSAIRARLKKKEPVLIFCSRRGYAANLTCSRCHWIPRCHQCDRALTLHKQERNLVCHYCRYTIPFENTCQVCGSKVIQMKGVGIEVIHEELTRSFPECRIKVFDADKITSKAKQDKIITDYNQGAVDLLLGTQILAHRRELAPAALVVIFFPENSLFLPDYQASQKTFHYINQMIGFLYPGEGSELYVQTALPQHYSIHSAAGADYQAFYDEEIKYRRIMQYPPFSHMFEIIFQGENLRTLAEKTRKFLSLFPSKNEDVEVLGPAKAPISRIRGRNRLQIVLKADEKAALDRVLAEVLPQIRVKKSVYLYE